MIVLSFYANCEAEFRRNWESLPPRCPELREVNAAIEAMRREHDPLASHILTGSLATERFGHTATLLPNGTALAVGGESFDIAFSTTELYDPPSETWTATGSLATARWLHTATLLPDGKVLGQAVTPIFPQNYRERATLHTWRPHAGPCRLTQKAR